MVPGLHGVGFWVDIYFLLLSFQCGGTLLFLNLLAARQGPRKSSKSRLAQSIGVLSVGFVVMGVLDGILGVQASCSEGCFVLQTGFLLALVAIYLLEASALRLVEGASPTLRGRIATAALSSWTFLLGTLAYWAFGWTLFFPLEANAVVLLYKVGPVSVFASSGQLLTAIALAPIAHVAFAAAVVRLIPSDAERGSHLPHSSG